MSQTPSSGPDSGAQWRLGGDLDQPGDGASFDGGSGGAPPPPSAQPSAPVSAVSLKRAPLLTGGLVIAFVLLGLLGIEVVGNLMPRLAEDAPLGELAGPVVFMIGLGLAALAVLGRRVYVRSRPQMAIELHNGFVYLPRSAEATARVRVPYHEILAVLLRGTTTRRFLMIEAREGIFIYSSALFEDARAPERLADALRMRISELERGADQLAEMGRRALLGQSLLSVAPTATHVLLGIVGVFFLNLVRLGDFRSPLGLIGWGAGVPPLTAHGEMLRLFASPLLHASFSHVAFCLLGLWVVSGLLERLVGRIRTVTVYIAGATAAAAAAHWLGNPLWVGSSGAVFALLGAYAALSLRCGTTMPLGFRQPRRWWMFVSALAAVMLFLTPSVEYGGRIEYAGHALALAVGALLAHGWLSAGWTPNDRRHANRFEQVVAALCSLAMASGLVFSVVNAAQFDRAARIATAERLALHPDSDVAMLNAVAWLWAVDKEPTLPELRMAETLSLRAIERAGSERAELVDTLATVHYRRGDLPRAINEEISALDASDQIFMAWQLARFLDAYASAAAAPSPVAAAAIGRFTHAGGKDASVPLLSLDIRDPAARSARVYLVAKQAGKRVGLVRVSVPQGTQGLQSFTPSPRYLYGRWPDDVQLETVWVEETGPASTRPGRAEGAEPTAVEWEVWPIELVLESYP